MLVDLHKIQKILVLDYSLEAPVTVTESHHHSPTMAMVVIGIGY